MSPEPINIHELRDSVQPDTFPSKVWGDHVIALLDLAQATWWLHTKHVATGGKLSPESWETLRQALARFTFQQPT